LADVTSASLEELELLLAAAFEEPALAELDSPAAIHGLLSIARLLQGPLAGAFAATPPPEGTLDTILARELLAADAAVRPIVWLTGDSKGALKDPEGGLVRASTRVRAVDAATGADAAVAAEAPVSIIGYAIDPLAAGAGAVAPGVSALVATGSVRLGSAPAGSDSLEQRALRERGFATTGADRQSLVALIGQSRAAASFCFSGAGALVALAEALAVGTPAAKSSTDVFGDSALVVARADTSTSAPTSASTSTGPWRDSDAERQLRYLLGRLAATAPVAAADAGLWLYDLTPTFELFRLGALKVYLYALTEGRDSERLNEFLERSTIQYAKAARLAELARGAEIAAAQARQFVLITEDKFGSARAATLLDALRAAAGARVRGAPGAGLARLADSIRVDDPGAVLALLTKREREVVEAEYDNRSREWTATVGNRCPHLRAARKLRGATSAADAQAGLRDLEKFIVAAKALGKTEAPPDAWLMCRECGFRALCPHVRDRVRLEGRRASYDAVRTALLKYAVRVRAGTEGDMYNYYCRICSERLAEFVEEDRGADAGRFGELDGGLRVKVWAAAMGAARFIRWPTPTDERQFAGAAAAVIYPALMAADEATIKSGRRSAGANTDLEDDGPVDPRLALLIVLFVYAYILDLVSPAGGRAEVGFEGVPLGAKASVYAERILRHVADTHRGIISQIEGVSADYIKARFTEAYRLVRGESAAAAPAMAPEEELACRITSIDPIYRYATTAARVAGDLPAARAATPAEARREFETAVGVSLPAVIQAARNNARDPALAALYLRRTGAEVPAGGSLDFLVKGPKANLYAKLYRPKPDAAGAASLAAFRAAAAAADLPSPGIAHWYGGKNANTKSLKRHALQRHAETPPKHAETPSKSKHAMAHPEGPHALAARGRFFEAYRLFALYTVVHSAEELAAYMADLATYRACEDGLRVENAVMAVKAYYDFGWATSQRWAPARTVSLATLYDESGRRHVWSGYVYGAAGAEVVVAGGPKAAERARRDDAMKHMALVDLVCGVCDIRFSRCGDLDGEKVRRAVLGAGEIGSFYVFYAARCPTGGLHEWVRGVCKKCGLAIGLLEEAALRSKAARAYYDEHAARFAEERRIAQSDYAALGSASAEASAASAADDSGDAAAAAWAADYTLVVRAAELAGVTPAVVEAIGQMDGREYADIADGRGAPAAPTNPADPRIFAADAEVRLFLSDYGLLRSAGRVQKLPPELAAIAAKHAGGGDLPDVRRGYHDLLLAIRRTRPAADAYTFAIQSLCRMVLEVAAAGALGAAFAAHEFALILRGQKLFSKPGHFNWAIFETADDVELAAEDQVGDIGEDVVEELLRNPDADEGVNDPYSGEHTDYTAEEIEANDEPA
jgi:hypothetical protein